MYIDIRKLTTEDWQSYKTIRLESLLKSPNSFASTYEFESGQDDAFWQDAVRTNDIFAAFEHEKIIGLCGFYILAGPRYEHRGKIWGMYVSNDYRGKGVADKLIDSVVNFAKNKVTQIHLSCMQRNEPAIKFYEKSGFVTYGIEPRAVKIGNDYFDDCLMVRMLGGE